MKNATPNLRFQIVAIIRGNQDSEALIGSFATCEEAECSRQFLHPPDNCYAVELREIRQRKVRE